MIIFNNDNPEFAAVLAARINATAAVLTDEQREKLLQTAPRCVEFLAEDLEKELRGIFVYESGHEGDIDSFLLDDENCYFLVMSTTAVDASGFTLKYFITDGIMESILAGPETDVDIAAQDEENEEAENV